MVFALAGDSTITRAFAMSKFCQAPPSAMSLGFQITQMKLPHFYKVLPRQLPDQAQHLQFEERRDELGSRRILNDFKQIIQMYGCVHLEGVESSTSNGPDFRTEATN